MYIVYLDRYAFNKEVINGSLSYPVLGVFIKGYYDIKKI